MVPSITTSDYWIWAHSLVDNNYPDHTEQGGKWLIFANQKSVDRYWSRIKHYTERGFLGHTSKVSTIKFGKTKKGFVICVYTYDSDDVDDVMDIREMLSIIGFKEKLHYKTDRSTLQGNYSGKNTGKTISKYCR